jgi:hypothetical protein
VLRTFSGQKYLPLKGEEEEDTDFVSGVTLSGLREGDVLVGVRGAEVMGVGVGEVLRGVKELEGEPNYINCLTKIVVVM